MKITKMYKRDDARRMAKTMLTIRAEQGEHIPVPSGTRRMQALPANVLAAYATRPAAFRTVALVNATNGCVTLRLGGAR